MIGKKEISSNYIGDFPNDIGGLNKFYSHEYADFSVVASNVNYNKRLWTIDDDYIISSITLKTPEYKTIRNIKVGDTVNAIHRAYDGIKAVTTESKITYLLGEMLLDFNLSDGKVVSIDMILITDNQ